MIIPRERFALKWTRALAAIGVAGFIAACSNTPAIPPAEQPLSKESMSLLGKKGMTHNAPIFIRIFKEESELEVWKAREDGRFYHFKTYPICNWSGRLGPKLKKGDKQAPEGFYTVSPQQMKPDSKYHVAFNMGFPNTFDRANRRTGQFLMVHGGCTSAGCYAMTDALVEEIYALAREAFRGGQLSFEVHAYPFRMTDQKLARFKKNKWYRFWRNLKQGYDFFEVHRIPPTIAVCERRYVVNVALPQGRRINPRGRCPNFKRPQFEPFAPGLHDWKLANERIVMPGPKMREVAEVERSAGDASERSSGANSESRTASGTATGTGASAFGPGAYGLGFNQ